MLTLDPSNDNSEIPCHYLISEGICYSNEIHAVYVCKSI